MESIKNKKNFVVRKIHLIAIGFAFLLAACYKLDSPSAKISMANGGYELAKKYCASCHLYPEPNLLDKKSWEQYLLPRMGNMLGVFSSPEQREILVREHPKILKRLYPAEPLLTKHEWDSINEYYLSNAPINIVAPIDSTIYTTSLPTFDLKVPDLNFSPPSTTLLEFIDTGIVLGDAHTKKMFLLDENQNILSVANTQEGAVSFRENSESFQVTVMGSFSPNDKEDGFIMSLPKRKNIAPAVEIENLRRPVHSAFGDLNNDGLEDVVVSEYGKWAGRLSLHFKQSDNTYKRTVLLNQTGPIKSEIFDYNKDGLPDIISLFGQGNEGFYLHTNQGDGKFTTKHIIRLSPSHGSSTFRLYDYNRDGNPDIIYTAGDNADFPSIYKPYHGLYVYLNNGSGGFKQSLFYPIAGAYAAEPADYDLDGDIDFAVISFFPDFHLSPDLGFIYLENTDNGFIARSFPNAHLGCWIVMDAKDYDDDGDMDLVLGSLAFEVPNDSLYVNHWTAQGIPFILLKNNTY